MQIYTLNMIARTVMYTLNMTARTAVCTLNMTARTVMYNEQEYSEQGAAIKPN